MKIFQQKSLLTLLCFLCYSGTVLLAQRQITGKVTDAENGEGLIGASIMVSGTSTGTATDFEGNFRLNLPADATSLRISYTGYGDKTIQIGTSNTIDVQLSPGIGLEETVIIGYGGILEICKIGVICHNWQMIKIILAYCKKYV